MENSYGIGVCNRYALFLDDESDPLELLKEKEQEKEQKKKTKVAEKENKAKTEIPLKGKPVINQKKIVKETPVPKPSVADNKREDFKPAHQRTSIDGKVERNLNKFSNENREERNNRRNREERSFNGPVEGNRDRDDRPRRENLGDNFENRNRAPRNVQNKEAGVRGPGGPKGRNFDNRRGKREFDRQSGSDKTGVKPVEKRDGGGAHNWGSHKDIMEEVDKSTEIDATWGESDKNDSGISTMENKESGEPEVEVVPEVEPKELTLDEYKAQQRAGRVKPQYNIRKAGEGEDPSQWKKMYELKKKENAEEESEDEEFEASENPQRVGRQKHILDIDIHFNDTRRIGVGGRGRGMRAGRGARPNRDRQRFRGHEEQVNDVQEDVSQRNAPKVDDERDFPSLG